MPLHNALWSEFEGGWSPNDDLINGAKNKLLRMNNVELDKNGALSLQQGTVVLRTVGDAAANGIYSKFLQGVRHDYLGLNSGKIYRDNTLLTSGGSTNRTAFSTAFDYTLITSQNYRVKDSGVGTPNNLGIISPAAPPTIHQIKYNSAPIITQATDVNNTFGFSNINPSAGFDYVTAFKSAANSANFPYYWGIATYDSVRTTNTTILTQSSVGVTSTDSTANDTMSFTFFGTDGAGHPLGSSQDLGSAVSITIKIYLVRPPGGSGIFNVPSDYFVYTWNTGTAANGDDVRLISPSSMVFKIRRQQFARVGADLTKNWNTVVGFEIGIGFTSPMVNNGGITFDQTFTGGQAGTISGTNSIDVQYAQMNVAKFPSYTAKSTLSAPFTIVNVENIGASIDAVIPTDPQVTEVWIFRQDNNLDEWYRVLVIPIANIGFTQLDTFSDDDALALDIRVNLSLVSAGVSGIADPILDIIGPISGRWYYFTKSFLYPSDIDDPDLINPDIGIRTCGSGSEVFLWSAKISESLVLVGTSIDIYVLQGTFTTLPDGSVDMYYRPMGCKFPPIARDFSQLSGIIYYMSESGWTSISASGENRIFVSPATDLLYQNQDRYNYSSISLVGDAPDSVRYPTCISHGKLYCAVTGTGRIEIYDFVRQYWRPCSYGLNDVSALFATQDGQVLGYYAVDFKLRSLHDQTTKLIDGVTNQSVSILSSVFDGGSPRNRKDLSTFKSRIYGSTGIINTSISTDQGIIVLNPTTSNNPIGEIFSDISQKLEACKWWQYEIDGNFPDFLLRDCSIDSDVRPTPLTFIRGRSNNFGTGSKKRLRTWPFIIDSRGNPVTLRIIVDNAIGYDFIFNTNEKTTVLAELTSDVFGIDYGYTLFDPLGLAEFYGEMTPELVQTLPIGKKFDQLGPVELFRYGKLQKLDVRVLPLDMTQARDTILDLPYTVYFDEIPLNTGLIKLLNQREGSYTIGLPKGTAGACLRIELGPTLYEFHRFNIRLLATMAGKDTEGQWVILG